MHSNVHQRRSIVQLMGWSCQQYGSFERYLVGLSRALSVHGAESHFIFQSQPPSREFVCDSSARIHVVPPARHVLDVNFIRRVRRLLQQVGATHLHVHHGTDAYLGLVAAKFTPVRRRFATRHIPTSNRTDWKRKSQYRWQAAQVERVFAVSEMVANRLIELGVPENKLQTYYLGVDPDRYQFSEGQRWQARDKLGIPRSRRVLLSTSHLRELKGTEVLPDLAAALNKDPGDTLVLVAGDGPMRDRMLTRIKELDLSEDSIRMLGVCRDIRPLLAAADIFLFTSKWEAFGLALLEGLASGIPAVSSTVVSDFVNLFGKTGILFYPPGDYQQLLEACRCLLADPLEAVAIGRRAQAIVHERLSTQKAIDEMVSIYLNGS